jgi:hypothetical protein
MEPDTGRERQRNYAVGPARRMINRVYTVLTRLGLGASYRHLLTVTGRRTGLPRTTPVDVMILDGRRVDPQRCIAPRGARCRDRAPAEGVR